MKTIFYAKSEDEIVGELGEFELIKKESRCPTENLRGATVYTDSGDPNVKSQYVWYCH